MQSRPVSPLGRFAARGALLRCSMRARSTALGVALLVAQVPALETGEAIPWCVAPDAYVTQPPLCHGGDSDTYNIELVSNAPRTWCSHRNLLAAMDLPFEDLPLPHEGQQAVCDHSSGHGDEARCTDVSDGALLAGDDGARATSLALTTSTGRIVLANLNTDESASFQASKRVKTKSCRPAPVAQAAGWPEPGGSQRRVLLLKGASGAPTDRRLSRLVFAGVKRGGSRRLWRVATASQRHHPHQRLVGC